MTAMTVRELSQDTSGAIHRVEVGEEIHVTKNGKLVAIIVPASAEQRQRAALHAAGLVDAPGSPGGLADLEPLPRAEEVPSLSDLLYESREDRW